jgi:hypothetical protein
MIELKSDDGEWTLPRHEVDRNGYLSTFDIRTYERLQRCVGNLYFLFARNTNVDKQA